MRNEQTVTKGMNPVTQILGEMWNRICRYPTDRVPSHISFKTRQRAGCASTCCHIPYTSGPCLPARWAPALPRHMAPNPASLLGRAPVLPRILWLRTSPPGWGGLWRYHASCSSLWAAGLSIKKGLAGLPMQLGSCIFKAHTHVPKAPDARAIMGLQDVRTGGIIITYKTCKQGATMQRRTVDHSRVW
jgi:hypothetical protein